jgi:hypothetical protein
MDLSDGEIIAYQLEKPTVYPLVARMLKKAFKKL